MQGWLTILCLQLTLFIAGLAWGWHFHQQRLSRQQTQINRLQQLSQQSQQQIIAQRQQVADALLTIENLQKMLQQKPMTQTAPVMAHPVVSDNSDYEKIRQLFKQGITAEIVQDSFNLSRSELEILASLQYSAA
jgi:hypothetical protein